MADVYYSRQNVMRSCTLIFSIYLFHFVLWFRFSCETFSNTYQAHGGVLLLLNLTITLTFISVFYSNELPGFIAGYFSMVHRLPLICWGPSLPAALSMPRAWRCTCPPDRYNLVTADETPRKKICINHGSSDRLYIYPILREWRLSGIVDKKH